jgi:hypothetical protein
MPPPGPFWRFAEIASPSNVRFAPIALKKSKIAGSENLAKVAHRRFQPLQGSVESIREPAVIFAIIHVVPQLAARKM